MYKWVKARVIKKIFAPLWHNFFNMEKDNFLEQLEFQTCAITKLTKKK